MKYLAAALSICFTTQAFPVCGNTIIDAGDFGLSELQPGEDATPCFREAVEACRKQNAAGLRVPAGEWNLHPDYAFEQRMAVANNDRGIKRVVFLLEDLDGFEFDASGANFVCHDEMIPISIERSNGVSLRGFSIDWAVPFYLQGKVVAVHPELNAFDLQLHPEVCYELRGNRLIFRGAPVSHPGTWRDWAPPPTERKSWEHNLQWNVWFNPETRHPMPGEHLWALNPDPKVEEVSPGVVRLFDALPQLPQTGWALVVKGMGSPNRTSPAIRLAQSKDLTLEDLSIHQSGGMGVIAQRCENITVRRLNVKLPEGKNRLVTTSADATHFNGCRGEILIEDCYFENMLDDATNVHGCFVRVEKKLGDRKVVCRLVHSQQRGLRFADSGDRVRFVNSENLQPIGDAEVIGVKVLNDDLFELEFDSIPDSAPLHAKTGLYNLSWQPNLTFRRCKVRNNRGRSMLIATSGRAVVEENLFERSTLAGIQFEGDNVFWWESGPTRDVTIRNNTFRDVMGHMLRFIPHVDPSREPNARYHGGVRFADNTIETYHRRIVQGKAINGLELLRNKIVMSDYLQEPVTPEPSFHFESGERIVLDGNTWESSPALTIRSDTPSSQPKLVNNTGIIKSE